MPLQKEQLIKIGLYKIELLKLAEKWKKSSAISTRPETALKAVEQICPQFRG